MSVVRLNENCNMLMLSEKIMDEWEMGNRSGFSHSVEQHTKKITLLFVSVNFEEETPDINSLASNFAYFLPVFCTQKTPIIF